MRAHGMVYFLFNAHQNANYCIPEGHGSATLFTRSFLPFCVGGAGHETNVKDAYYDHVTLSKVCKLHNFATPQSLHLFGVFVHCIRVARGPGVKKKKELGSFSE